VREGIAWQWADPIDGEVVRRLLGSIAHLPPPEADAGLFLAMTALSCGHFYQMPWKETLDIATAEGADHAATIATARQVCELLHQADINAAEATIFAVRRQHYAALIIRASVLRMTQRGRGAPQGLRTGA
jgi:hypothetical protein